MIRVINNCYEMGTVCLCYRDGWALRIDVRGERKNGHLMLDINRDCLWAWAIRYGNGRMIWANGYAKIECL